MTTQSHSALQHKLEHIRFVTQNYHRIPGLRLLPWALSFLCISLFWITGLLGIATAMLALTPLLSVFFMRAYYQKRFGIVRKSVSRKLNFRQILGVAAVTLIITVLLKSLGIDSDYISLFTLLTVFSVYEAYLNHDPRRYYYVLYAMFLIVAVLFYFLLPTLQTESIIVAAAIFMVIQAIADHIYLSKHLPVVQADNEAGYEF